MYCPPNIPFLNNINYVPSVVPIPYALNTSLHVKAIDIIFI